MKLSDKLNTAQLPSRKDFKSIGPKYLAAGLNSESFSRYQLSVLYRIGILKLLCAVEIRQT